MTWWVFSYLDTYRPPHGFSVLAKTPEPCHMFIRWWKVPPRRHLIYRNIRGSAKYCGYKYFWAESHCHEQTEPGYTYTHLFPLMPLNPRDHVWYYLFSMMTAPPMEHQGPLIHVPPPELPMPTARIFHSVAQPCPTDEFTILTFDSYLWDDYGFYDPADPTKLTIPVGALYTFGASARLVTGTAMRASLSIRINASYNIAYHGHAISATDFGGGRLSLQSIMAFRPADFIQCRIYHTAGLARDVVATPEYSPHFWIAQIGAYPPMPA